MSDWKDLDINSLPSDILVGDYEFEWRIDGCWNTFDVKENVETEILSDVRNYRFRYRKRQSKAPSHEEIMTKWWKDDGRIWIRVIAYCDYCYVLPLDGSVRTANWFTSRESADIPPEVN